VDTGGGEEAGSGASQQVAGSKEQPLGEAAAAAASGVYRCGSQTAAQQLL
jgi:hypothetical protein